MILCFFQLKTQFFPAQASQTLNGIKSVAVGMPVTRHPPHRSQHALLMHWAPTSGV